MEKAFVSTSIVVVLPESPEDFSDVAFVAFGVVGVDEDVIQID
jgi:hypothetical protein